MQVVVHEGVILEKPRDAEEVTITSCISSPVVRPLMRRDVDATDKKGYTMQARRFIRGYGRSPGKTVGSVLCTDLASQTSYSGIDTAEVTLIVLYCIVCCICSKSHWFTYPLSAAKVNG